MYSLDGGVTWTGDTFRQLYPQSALYAGQADPTVAAHANGVFYYGYIDINPDPSRLVVAKTIDGGVTWNMPPTVLVEYIGQNAHFVDKPYLTVDRSGTASDGKIVVTYTVFSGLPTLPGCQFGKARIMYSFSTDGGATFSGPTFRSDNCADLQGSVPAVGPSGEIYVAWLEWFDSDTGRIVVDGLYGNDVTVATIDPLPRKAESELIPGTTFRVNSFPTIAVDHSTGVTRGNVCVAWADETGVDGSGPDILFARSTDGGQTWCPPVRATDDPTGMYPAGEYQWFPWMTIDEHGNIDIVFYDRRLDPSSDKFNLYHARSVDGGLSFGPNMRLSSSTSDAINDGFISTSFIGDYNGLTVGGGSVHPFWADLSGDNAEGFTSSFATAGAPPCPQSTADVIDGTMSGFAGSGLYPETMTLFFNFETTEQAERFKVRFRKTHPVPDLNWTEITCDDPSSICLWNCDGSVEAAVVYPDCGKLKFEWQAMGYNCQGWQSGWSSVMSFSTLCLTGP